MMSSRTELQHLFARPCADSWLAAAAAWAHGQHVRVNSCAIIARERETCVRVAVVWAGVGRPCPFGWPSGAGKSGRVCWAGLQAAGKADSRVSMVGSGRPGADIWLAMGLPYSWLAAAAVELHEGCSWLAEAAGCWSWSAGARLVDSHYFFVGNIIAASRWASVACEDWSGIVELMFEDVLVPWLCRGRRSYRRWKCSGG